MSEYDVVLKDRDGCDICTDLIDGLVAAKARAKYLLSDEHAKQMRANSQSVRNQLMASVCSNTGYRQLLARGAVLRYQFSVYKSNLPVATERFNKTDCGLK